MGSLARASRDANVDPPRRHLGVLLLAREVELGRPDIGVPGELAHFVERRPVPDGIVDGGLRSEWMPIPRPPSRSGSMPAARQYFLTSRQGVLRPRCRRSSPVPSGFMGRKSGPSLSSPIPARAT